MKSIPKISSAESPSITTSEMSNSIFSIFIFVFRRPLHLRLELSADLSKKGHLFSFIRFRKNGRFLTHDLVAPRSTRAESVLPNRLTGIFIRFE